MKGLVNRNKNNLFKKRHYVAIIKNVTEYLTHAFGYKRKPFLFESVNEKGVEMIICRGKKEHYAIFYDYMQFKKVYGDLEFEGQEAYATFIIAHEMRHYYQMRQLDSKHPKEPKERLDKWRIDDEAPQSPLDESTLLEFYMRPMELDAELFAYVFVADMLGIRVKFDYIDENYIKELEKYYIELFGKTSSALFPKDSTDS